MRFAEDENECKSSFYFFFPKNQQNNNACHSLTPFNNKQNNNSYLGKGREK